MVTETRQHFYGCHVVGCLPGCAVGFIMMVMQKPVDKAVYDAIEAKGKLLDGISGNVYHTGKIESDDRSSGVLR